MATTSNEQESFAGFPWFEENNFSGWLIQFKAHLRKVGAHLILEQERPKDIGPNGEPLQMNAQQRRAYEVSLAEYDKLDNIAYSELMKACRLNPKTKNLSETGGFATAHDLLVRLRQRYNNIDEIAKASHLLHYHSLKQKEGESGAEFVDREQREYLALREMGINVDDSLRLTKFIQQDTTNSKHRSLAQTIYSTPAMTLNRATSLFENYQPSSSTAVSSSVNALFCTNCKKSGHDLKSCKKKSNHKRKQKNFAQKQTDSKISHKPKKQRFPCAICEDKGHITHLCPRKAEVQKCLGIPTRKVTWGADEDLSDENDK